MIQIIFTQKNKYFVTLSTPPDCYNWYSCYDTCVPSRLTWNKMLIYRSKYSAMRNDELPYAILLRECLNLEKWRWSKTNFCCLRTLLVRELLYLPQLKLPQHAVTHLWVSKSPGVIDHAYNWRRIQFWLRRRERERERVTFEWLFLLCPNRTFQWHNLSNGTTMTKGLTTTTLGNGYSIQLFATNKEGDHLSQAIHEAGDNIHLNLRAPRLMGSENIHLAAVSLNAGAKWCHRIFQNIVMLQKERIHWNNTISGYWEVKN